MINLYNYKAKVENVIDGDTIDVIIDLGFDIKINQTVRLTGIDTPEIHTKNTKEKSAGLIVRKYVEDLLGKEIYLKTTEFDDKYGRYLAEVYTIDYEWVNDHLINIGLAKIYLGKTKEKWTDSELEVIEKFNTNEK
jgi:micrococcal nuclease